MSNHREYEKEYKVQAVNLAKQFGSTKADEELQILVNRYTDEWEKQKWNHQSGSWQSIYPCCIQFLTSPDIFFPPLLILPWLNVFCLIYYNRSSLPFTCLFPF